MRKLYIGLGLLLAASAATARGATEALPYEITFNSTNYNTWTSVDDGQNEITWKNLIWMWNNNSWWYSLTSAQKTPANDWVVSPTFAIAEGTQYEVSYKVDRYSGDNATLTLALIDGLDSPMSKQEIDVWNMSSDKGIVKTVTFTASAGGDLRIGLHMGMTYNGSAQKIKFVSFSIKALSKASAPAAVADFTATPGALGAATAMLTFTAPLKDAEGNDLSGTVDVNLYREDEETPFHTVTGLAPGAAGSYTDTEAYTGETWYLARAVTDGGESVEARADAWIGEDEPLAVTINSITTAGKPSIAWTPAEGGVHGGYVNTSGLTYVISRVADGQLTKAGETSERSFTDADLDDSRQANVSYQVVAKSGAGLGAAAQTEAVNVGPQLALPFAESFADTAYSTTPWMQQTVRNAEGATREPSWELLASKSMEVDATDDNPEGVTVTISSQDTDRGMIAFKATGQWTNYCESRLVMPSIDFTGMLNPVLTFYIFRESWSSLDPATQNGRNDDYITVAARSANGEFTAAEGEFHRYGKQNAWELCEVPLYAFAGLDRVQVALVGHGVGNTIYIDNIRIEERTAYDLAITGFSAPERIRVGEPGGISAVIKNNGGFTANEYSVELYKNDVKVETAPGNETAPGKSTVVRFEYSPSDNEEEAEAVFSAKIVYAPDQEAANNVSETAGVAITAPLLPAVNTLEGGFAQDKTHLTWQPASWLPAETLKESDGFETYAPFSIDTFGDFSSYDMDNRITVPITGLTYPNAGEKMACQIMTPAMTNIDPEELDLWTPHGGSSMVVFPQATSATADIASNDWLVFPMLSGNAQIIKMWLRSVNAENYPEYILGYYATTSDPTDADDFLPCPDSEASYAVPTAWTLKDYSVPAGAKWFALRHISQSGYMLMLDDVSYERAVPAIEPDGYNVYCNGVKANDELLTDCVFDHRPNVENSVYTVKAVYGDRESTASNEVSVNITGVDIVEAEEMETEYFTLQGIRVTEPGCGVYIIRRGGECRKVVIER